MLLPLWNADHADLRNVHDGDGGLSGARVARAARYLGVLVGTDTREGQWYEVAANVAARARDVAPCGVSWPTRLRLFAMHMTSLVRYRAKFCRMDARIVSAYRGSAQRVLAAPWMAMPPDSLHNVDLLGLPAVVPPLLQVCQTAPWATLGAQGALQEEWRRFDDELDGDDAALAVHGAGAFRRDWHAHSSITVLLRAEDAERQGRAERDSIPASASQQLWMQVVRRDVVCRRSELDAVLRRR